MSFWIRRLGHAASVLFAVSILAFLFLELAPGDYLDRVRLNPRISPETLEAMRAQYGLDRSFAERYVRWVLAVFDGTWGFSFAYGSAVAPLISSRALNTLVLSVSAAVVAWSIALPVGVLWALRRARVGSVLAVLTSVVIGLPELVLAVLFLILAERTRAFPVGGMWSIGAGELPLMARLSDLLRHLVLPVTALALPMFSVLSRHVRSAVSEVLEEPFVFRARSLGLASRAIVLHHLLRPAASPLISIAGLSIASLLSASFIVEVVMGWPGLGPFLLDAIRARDVHVVIGGVMCSAVLVVAGGVVTDVALYSNDPRIKAP